MLIIVIISAFIGSALWTNFSSIIIAVIYSIIGDSLAFIVALLTVLNEQLEAKLPEGNYETIAGLIISRLGRIPKEGEQLILNEFRILVTKAERTRIQEVRIIRREDT